MEQNYRSSYSYSNIVKNGKATGKEKFVIKEVLNGKNVQLIQGERLNNEPMFTVTENDQIYKKNPNDVYKLLNCLNKKKVVKSPKIKYHY